MMGVGWGFEEIVNKRHKLSIIGMVRWPSGQRCLSEGWEQKWGLTQMLILSNFVGHADVG